MSKPLAIDLYCGSFGGWAKGFLSEGFDVVGFDLEVMPGPRYPGQLVLQDVLTLHGSQFRNAVAIVCSPPCQRYSYMAMPWQLAKREVRWQQWERDSPFGDRLAGLNALFDACFRIQREASEAAGHHIPLVVENVKGAQKWVGRAAWHYGSFYLWGDVPALMPFAGRAPKLIMDDIKTDWVVSGRKGAAPIGPPSGGNSTGATSWFGTSRCDPRDMGRNEDGEFTWMGLTGEGVKVSGDWFGSYAEQKAAGTISPGRLHGNRSSARKAASAQIAEIPFDLAQHIARCFRP
jgi:hypothetical protein